MKGFDPDGVAETGADHFGNCLVYWAYLLRRDMHSQFHSMK